AREFGPGAVGSPRLRCRVRLAGARAGRVVAHSVHAVSVAALGAGGAARAEGQGRAAAHAVAEVAGRALVIRFGAGRNRLALPVGGAGLGDAACLAKCRAGTRAAHAIGATDALAFERCRASPSQAVYPKA